MANYWEGSPGEWNKFFERAWPESIFSLYPKSNQQGGNMKIQLNRVKLLTALEAKLQSLRDEETASKDVVKQVEKYEQEVLEYTNGLQDRIKLFKTATTLKELDSIINNIGTIPVPHLPNGTYGNIYLDPDIRVLQSLINQLNMSDSETVEANDKSEYSRFL